MVKNISKPFIILAKKNMNDNGSVAVSYIEEHIAEITFFHPAHNSLPANILKALAERITAVSKQHTVEIIVLKSAGDRTFCAGASFNELVAIDNEEAGKTFFMGFANVINACRKSGKIIIGRVQGKAVGGGVGLAASVDYCLATKYAAIKLSELAVGIGPFVVGPAVQRKIGLSAFTHLTINATEFKNANWAKDKGLYDEVFETVEQLDEAVLAMAKNLATTNPEARAALKKVFWQGTENWDDLLAERASESGRLVLSNFTKKTLAKFNKA